jgi:hypothetical protein
MIMENELEFQKKLLIWHFIILNDYRPTYICTDNRYPLLNERVQRHIRYFKPPNNRNHIWEKCEMLTNFTLI